MIEADEIDHLKGPASDLGLLAVDPYRLEPGFKKVFACLLWRHHHQVLQRGHQRELMGDLKGTQQALVKQGIGRLVGNVFAIEQNLATVQWQGASDNVEQGRLAGSVGADQSRNGALLYLQ